ncbi:MAG: hypothetical protein ABH887_01885 [bacterium]
MPIDKLFVIILMIISLIGLLLAIIAKLSDKSKIHNSYKQKKEKKERIDKITKHILLNAAIDYQRAKLVCDNIFFKIRIGFGKLQNDSFYVLDSAKSEYVNEDIKVKQAYDPIDWLAGKLNQYCMSDTLLVKIIIKTFNTNNRLICKIRCYQINNFRITKEIQKGD